MIYVNSQNFPIAYSINLGLTRIETRLGLLLIKLYSFLRWQSFLQTSKAHPFTNFFFYHLMISICPWSKKKWSAYVTSEHYLIKLKKNNASLNNTPSSHTDDRHLKRIWKLKEPVICNQKNKRKTRQEPTLTKNKKDTSRLESDIYSRLSLTLTDCAQLAFIYM